ncbi:MAG: zinc ribbon domain-containing protein [Kiritimatiellae bacterium]|nr:zinc ribbon domain-containing protein [Kiritimatiellia bacterium]
MTDKDTPGRTALLSAAQMAGLIAERNLAVRSTSPLVPFVNADEKATKRDLKGTGVLDKEWASSFEILAGADRRVRVLVAGPSEVLVSTYYGMCEGGMGQLVGCWEEDDAIRLSCPWTAEGIASLASMVLLSQPPVAPISLSAQLSQAGFTALVAAVDVVRGSVLDSIRYRRLDPEMRFDYPALEQCLEDGLTEGDARWAVTLFQRVGPEGAPLEREDLDAGFKELVRAELIQTEGDSWEPGLLLRRLAADWRIPLPAVAHEVVTTTGIEHRIAVRGAGPLWTVDHLGLAKDAVAIELRSMHPATYLEGLVGMMKPPASGTGAPADDAAEPAADDAPEAAAPAPERFCRKCGARLRPGKPFCPACGQESPRAT